LCKEFAQAMGGTIGVDSEEGQGASFWVRLPLARTASSSPKRTRPLRVLVVDDDVVSRTVTASLIAKSGDAATAVDGGAAALAALTAAPEPFDAAVVDLRMPDMDGFTLVRRIRQGHAGAAHTAMTVVALTASDSDGPACAEAGFDAYLVKPVDATALAATFAQLASAPRLS
jgi:CheY-like chemotaxis protein